MMIINDSEGSITLFICVPKVANALRAIQKKFI